MPTWWLWRWRPAPKKVIAEIELPWSYLASEPFADDDRPGSRLTGIALKHRQYTASYKSMLLEGLDRIERALEEQKLPTDMMVEQAPFGGMRRLLIRPNRGTRGPWALTPPVFQFADLSKHFDRSELREVIPGHGDHTYWVQPEVFEATGEFLSGAMAYTHQGVVKLADTMKVATRGELYDPKHPEDARIADFLLIALDSFMERGAPDPRFNPRPPDAVRRRPRRNAPTTVEDIIQVAMDIAEDRREGWWLKATRMLHQVGGGKLDGNISRDRFAVAQCIRSLPTHDPRRLKHTLYRIWGQTRLTEGPYVILSESTLNQSYGTTNEWAIFPATADATELLPKEGRDHVWPITLDDPNAPFLTGEDASYRNTYADPVLADVGVTHSVPCGAQLLEDW